MEKVNIRKSKNLIYQNFSVLADGSGVKNPPSKSILQKFEYYENKIILHFKNSYIAEIKAKNLDGERELYKIAQRLPEFVGKSYEEILNFNF